MKKTFFLIAITLFGSLSLFTSCNTNSDDTPPTYRQIGKLSQDFYSGKNYLLLPTKGEKALCKGLSSDYNSGDLLITEFTIESTHSDTSAYQYVFNIQGAAKINTQPIKQTRLDTLGNSFFTSKSVSLLMLENYLFAEFGASVENGDNFFLAADSVRLEKNRLVKNDTMFLELRHRSKYGYGSYTIKDLLFANLSNESYMMNRDSLVIVARYKVSENDYEEAKTVAYRKFLGK